MAHEIIRWGILGAGSIARTFAIGLTALSDAKLVAVGSRGPENAGKFAAEHGGIRAHASYEALAEDAEVDAIYIATPHPYHHANALLCIANGKAVLVEKPFAMNAAQALEIADAARAMGVPCVEAMWTRFLPVMRQVRGWLKSGEIGHARLVLADFGFRGGDDPKSRLLDPALGGGALLDVGVYTVSFAHLVYGGEPERVEAVAAIGHTGVDEQIAVSCAWSQGRLAQLTSAVRTNTPHDARILGTTGAIHLPVFWHAHSAILTRDGQPAETFAPAWIGNGYHYEAAEIGRLLRAGEVESPELPLAETVAIMRTMDRARHRIGLRYAQDGAPNDAARQG